MDTVSDKQHAHELIERLPASQVATAVRLLEFMLHDPVAHAIRNAPLDDEPETNEERQAVAEATEWLKHNRPIPFEEVLADMGLTLEDVKNYKEPD
jgi:hypothetical protein